MKIVVPIRSIKEVDFLLRFNITEVYGGYIDIELRNITGGTGIINGRSSKKGNFKNIEEIKIAVNYIKKKGINFNFTFNTLPFFSYNNLLEKAINNSKKIGFENVIISDHILMEYFSKQNIIISTLATVYNISSINYYLSKFNNIKRVILPRELSINEQKKIISTLGNKVEFEMLVLNDWCYNNNFMCSSIHYNELPKGIVHTCKRDINYKSKDKKITDSLKEIVSKRLNCKICIMYHFKKYNNIFFKIAGRTKNIKDLKKDILFAYFVKKQVFKSSNYESFKINTINLYKKIYGYNCDYKNCELYKLSSCNYV